MAPLGLDVKPASSSKSSSWPFFPRPRRQQISPHRTPRGSDKGSLETQGNSGNESNWLPALTRQKVNSVGCALPNTERASLSRDIGGATGKALPSRMAYAESQW